MFAHPLKKSCDRQNVLTAGLIYNTQCKLVVSIKKCRIDYMKIMLKLQFLTCKKYSEQRSTVKNCNFSKLQLFQCTSTAISLHIFAVDVGSKEARFLAKNQYTHRKPLYFENRGSTSSSKIGQDFKK